MDQSETPETIIVLLFTFLPSLYVGSEEGQTIQWPKEKRANNDLQN
jgi:hypothetical protein